MEAFQAVFDRQYAAVAKSGFREKAWDHFLELGLPSRHMEMYQYIKLSKLFSCDFTSSAASEIEIDSYVLPECQNSVLVFVNGRFRADLSRREAISDRVVVTSLEKAEKTYAAYLQNYRAKHLKKETDPFAAANAALAEEGAFLYVPPKTAVDVPVQLLNLIDAGESSMLVLPRLHLFVGELSELTLAATTEVKSGSSFLCSSVTEMALEKGAKVHLTQSAVNQTESGWVFDALRANLKRDSRLETVAATSGSATVRNDYHVVLEGENAEGLLNGVWNLKGKREAHHHVLMEHQAPHCHSMQLFKGVLEDFSRSSFEGKIYVHQAAQKTDAFQLNQNLLLSDSANADSKPNLEIFADDVKASHGATIGQLDPEHLLYMKTRGISEKQAKELLVEGYCQEVLDKAQPASLRERIADAI